ncbi:MAG: ABC transporter permease [Cyclobacteriaceae bacterium]
MAKLPKLAKRLFQWYCNPLLEEQILGDLQEQFEEDAETYGVTRAKWRFTWSVIRFFRPGIIKNYKGIENRNNYDMLRHNLKIAFRNLSKQKSIAIINIGGLVLGLLVTLMIGLWVENELSWDKDNENYDRVVRVMQKRVFDEDPRVIRALPASLSAELSEKYADVFDQVVLSSFYWEALITNEDDAINVTGAVTQAGAPHVMSLRMISGSRDGLNEEASILLSESSARALFGEGDPMNQTVRLNDRNVIIHGVYEDFPGTSSFRRVDFIANTENHAQTNWSSNTHQIFATISANASLEDINEKIKHIVNDHLPENRQNAKNEVFLHPMKDWHLRSSWKNGVQSGGNIIYVQWFGLIGLLVLFLACINFMNLSTAQSVRRAKEVGIRKSIGSVRHQLVIQFMTESILLVFISFLIVTGFSYLLIPYFNHLVNKEISIPLDTWRYWSYGLALVFGVGILAGSYPSLYLSSFRPIQVLKGTYQNHLSAVFFRKGMVVFQFTISIALIIGTMVIAQQIDHAVNRPLGYDNEGTITVAMSSSDHHDKSEVIENELIRSGAIAHYAESFNPLTEVWMMNHDFEWAGKDPAFTPMINTLYVSPNFGNTIKWEIMEGRDFNQALATDSSALIINETAARTLGIADPVGLALDWQENSYKVIGVVKDLLNDSPFKETGPTFYFYGGESRLNYSLIRLNDQLATTEAIDKVAEVYEKLIPNVPFEFEFVSEAYQQNFQTIQKISSLSSIFSSFAIIISCLGLFGLASFMVEQRTKEIGVRKVLGASVLQLWRLISQEFIVLVSISGAIAIPVALWTLRGWLESYEYRIDLQWWVFVTACMGAVVLTIATTSLKSLAVIRLNPARTLKDE